MESLEDLAARVRELEATREADAQGVGSPTEMYSPTELPEGAGEQVSPLMQLKRMVDAEMASSSKAEPAQVAMDIEKDEFNMIVSESE